MLQGEPGLFLSYITLFFLNTVSFITHIPPNLQVLVQTPAIVYVGCIHSIRLYCQSTDTKSEGIETMTRKDALLFPVIGSITLGGLFLAFKYIDGEWINFLFHYYFTVIGVFVITTFFYNRLKEVFVVLSSKDVLTIPKIPYLSEAATPIDLLYIIIFAFASVVGVAYFLTKHYFLNNVYGVFFSIVGIESVMVGATNIGFILLVLLFFYDIYWVFFTPVMVTVAKSLQGPIKLMFPKSFEWVDQTNDFNMIGLGDIVIPGIYVALILRYDYLRVLGKMKEKGEKILTDAKGNFIIPFTFNNFATFIFTFFGYFLGILSTLIVMNVFDHAQPALLYLVPGVLIGSSLPALFRRKFVQFFMFEETTELVRLGLREEEKKEEENKKDSSTTKDSDKKENAVPQKTERSVTPKKKVM